MKEKTDYKVVNFVDVNELLGFVRKEYKQLEKQIDEEKRVEDELKEFIYHVEKHSGHKFMHIGSENRKEGFLIKYLLKDGGYMEVIANKPLTINAHFLSHKSANKFANGLKKALNKTLPEHPVKQIMIESIKVQEGVEDNILDYNKWGKIHKLTIKNTAVVTIVALLLFIVIEWTKELFKATAEHYFPFQSFFVSILTAILIALFFERIRDKVEDLVGKIFKV